ncbi:MAG: NAD(+) synthase [Clostridia bacterium]|nr:NAD(+) synthase [Clostridia bacterium]
MKHSFVRVAAVSPELKVADVKFNTAKIIAAIEAQAKADVEILVFPELSLSGYTCGDLFLDETLLKACLVGLKQIAEATNGKKMLVFVGLPFELQGGKVYNCAAAICDGKVKGLVPKSSLPNYGEFYEQRYFVAAPPEGDFVTLWEDERVYLGADCMFFEEEHNVTVACEICEDLWAPRSPSTSHAVTKAEIVVNLSASNETVGKREYRKALISAHSGKNVCAYIYANAGTGESTSDTVFSGNHLIYENGTCLAEAKPFSGESCVAEIDVGFLKHERRKLNTFHDEDGVDHFAEYVSFVGDSDLKLRKISRTPFVPEGEELKARSELILSIQANALAQRYRHTSSKTAVIGVSGGLDSALALLVTARAFDILGKSRKDIIAVTMPGFGTTKGTKNNSILLANETGATLKEIGISKTVLSHFEDIGHDSKVLDATYENAQARYRTMILMDLANDTNGLVIGTGDLSELALGWCTYNGDHMSMYAVNSSVPKTLVKHLVAYEAARLGGKTETVLKDILDTEISPELLPPDKAGNIAQKTEDVVGPYELHDFFLHRIVRCGDTPAKVYDLACYAFKGAYDKKTVKKWLVNFYKRFFSQQFKRNCVPDGVKVGSVSLSPRADWRMPSDAQASLWLEEAENL